MRQTSFAILRFLFDITALCLAFLAAFLIRLDFAFDASWFMRMALHLPIIVVFELGLLLAFGALRGAWRFVSIADVSKIGMALLLAQIPLIAERLIFGALLDDHAWMQDFILPWGVIAINYFAAFLACVGMRVLRRLLFEHKIRLKSQSTSAFPFDPIRTLLIGAGQMGKQIADSIQLRPELGIEVAGYISDNPNDRNRHIAGIRVLGNLDELPEIAKARKISQAIITLPDAHGDDLRAILEKCSQAQLKTKIVPPFNDIIGGKLDIGQIREISVEDLLHRAPVVLDQAQISNFLTGRSILVSGAGGSIGSEICRQVLKFKPKELVMVEQCELFLYELERELLAIAGDVKLCPCLVDICDLKRLDAVFEVHSPEVVFHAAAYKHVPMLEQNPGEAIRNNVLGTMHMADVAAAHQVSSFVMISTDKAVNPTSIMGTSKRIAELYIQSMTATCKTRFSAVRFGNVLGSTGSVLPLFREQIVSGGPLTVTHPDMIRYFMTIPEASQLVMQAATMGHGGEIFVLDMGKPVKILDLARDLIRLSGKTPDDIPITFTGMRPGEKLFEELGFDEEHMSHTEHPQIYIGKLQGGDHENITNAIQKLMLLSDCSDNAKVRSAMKDIVPEML